MIIRCDYSGGIVQRVASEGVAMEACDLVAAKTADQSSMSFRVFTNFNDDKMTPSDTNTHHMLRCVCSTRGGCTCGEDVILGGIR